MSDQVEWLKLLKTIQNPGESPGQATSRAMHAFAELVHLRAELSTARAEAEAMRVRIKHMEGVLIEAVEPLVKVLDEIEGNKSFRGIWPFLHVHGYVYTGPSYATELRDARAALQAHRPHGEEK